MVKCMSNYELSVDLNYVPDWTEVEAVREIFQNAIDQQQNGGNEMYFKYVPEEERLFIGNKNSSLTKKSLLIGSSTKRDDSKTIGQHGEGYKIATVVLLRMGLGLKIFNYCDKEIWTAKKINSRRYGTQIPAFSVEKCIPFIRPVENQNLIFQIDGITPEMYARIVASNLHLQGDLGDYEETDNGKILKNPKYKGMVFVGGLYICTENRLTYGYDFKPNVIRLDRDRKTVGGTDLQSACSSIVAKSKDVAFIKSMIDTYEGYFLEYRSDNVLYQVAESLADDFYQQYGENAVAVTSQDDFDVAQRYGVNPKFVSATYKGILSRSTSYNERNEKLQENIVSDYDRISTWYEKAKEHLPEELLTEGNELIELILEKFK